jgi:hypothetical protein
VNRENPLTDALRVALLSGGGRRLRIIADKLDEKAEQGDLGAIQQIPDRLDSKCAQVIERGDLCNWRNVRRYRSNAVSCNPITRIQIEALPPQDGNPYRWSVAFPIVDTYRVIGRPKAPRRIEGIAEKCAAVRRAQSISARQCANFVA